MKTKKIIIIIGGILILLIAVAAIWLYPSYRFFFQKETQALDKNLIIIRGGGGNSGILVTDKAVVVIDTKMFGDAEDLSRLVKEKAGNKQIIVINTHYHGDHVKGNKYYKGDKIYIGNYDKTFLEKNIDPENMPTDIVKDSLVFDMGDEVIHLVDLGQAHTFHDMVVYLQNRKILFTGDLIFDKVNPVLKKESGANVDKWIAVLDIILTRWDINTIIPGHGPGGGKEIAASLKQYFIDMKKAAADPGLEKEMTTKYKNWMEMPMMASPANTIDYIRENP